MGPRMFWRRPNSLATVGFRPPHLSARSLVATADKTYDPVMPSSDLHTVQFLAASFYFSTLKTFVSQAGTRRRRRLRTKLRSKFGGLLQCVTRTARARSVNSPGTQLFVLF